MTVGADGQVITIRVVADPGPDHSRRLWGWKDIAQWLDKSERWARDHVPVTRVGRSVTITTAGLERWLNSLASGV